MGKPLAVIEHYLVGDDAGKQADPLKYEVGMTNKNGRYSTMLHVMALATILERRIVSLFPKVNNSLKNLGRHMLSVEFLIQVDA